MMARKSLLQVERELCILWGRRALLLDLLATEWATADDVWDVVPMPEGVDRRCLAAVPRPLVRLGIIRSARRVRSVRPECHGAWINLWRLADRGGAKRWLRENPGWPDGGSELAA